MTVPEQDVSHIYGASPAYIQQLLEQGMIISGPGSETRDVYFFKAHDKYVYLSEAQGVGKTHRHQFTATAQGLINMMCFALFHGAYFGEKR